MLSKESFTSFIAYFDVLITSWNAVAVIYESEIPFTIDIM